MFFSHMCTCYFICDGKVLFGVVVPKSPQISYFQMKQFFTEQCTEFYFDFFKYGTLFLCFQNGFFSSVFLVHGKG